MARSSSYDFSLTRDNILNAAFRLLGVIGDNQTASSTRLSQAGQALNMMIRLWQAEGIALWKNTEIVLVPQADQIQYGIGPSANDYCSLESTFTKTEIATSTVATGTTIYVDSTSGWATGYTVGIETVNGDIHWSVISDVTNNTTFVIATALDYQTAVDSHVYYSTDWTIPRPMEIIQAWSKDSEGYDVPILIDSLFNYRMLSNKTTEGRPNTLAFDPTLDDITIYLWPEPNNMKELVYMIAKIPFQDFDSTSDDPDFPPEWSEALVYNIAIRLAAEYGRTPSQLVTAMALSSYETLKGFSREEVSVKFVPNRREYQEPRGY